MEMYCIKFKNMYLCNLNVSSDYPENNFICGVDFKTKKSYVEQYPEETARQIIKKLTDIGYNAEYLELELIEEDENND